jgi:hypothetical protein
VSSVISVLPTAAFDLVLIYAKGVYTPKEVRQLGAMNGLALNCTANDHISRNVCRSYGARRRFLTGIYKDFAPTELDRYLERIVATTLRLRS